MSLNAYRVRSKICGLTREQDVHAAVQAGADAIGLVFYPPSPRYVSIEQAAKLCQHVPPYVQIVGLFVNPQVEQLHETLGQVPLDVLQFHGDESPEACQAMAHSCQRRWYKAIQVKPELDLLEEIYKFQKVGTSALLLDAWHPELKGGTGLCFDWQKFPKIAAPLILAGGLNPDNVATAIACTQPHAVDVSGGVELSKGIKDPQLMQKFIQGVHRGSNS